MRLIHCTRHRPRKVHWQPPISGRTSATREILPSIFPRREFGHCNAGTEAPKDVTPVVALLDLPSLAHFTACPDWVVPFLQFFAFWALLPVAAARASNAPGIVPAR